MKKIASFSMLVLILLLATACGSAAPAATQIPTQPAATEPATAEPTATEPAVTEPAATQSSPTEVGAVGTGTQVDVTLADNTIDSSMTTFQVGVPYTFVITNAGRHGHNFNISTPVSDAGSLEAALQTALLAVPQSQLNPGASVTVEYTFPDTAEGQNLEFACLIRMHYQMGMLLPITVTQ
jgi:uncharacterized cupredoxin-like copper-binding protein